MWYLFKESLTDGLRIFCNILAFIVPYAIYKTNKRMHEKGDPPWKKNERHEREESELP